MSSVQTQRPPQGKSINRHHRETLSARAVPTPSRYFFSHFRGFTVGLARATRQILKNPWKVLLHSQHHRMNIKAPSERSSTSPCGYPCMIFMHDRNLLTFVQKMFLDRRFSLSFSTTLFFLSFDRFGKHVHTVPVH